MMQPFGIYGWPRHAQGPWAMARVLLPAVEPLHWAAAWMGPAGWPGPGGAEVDPWAADPWAVGPWSGNPDDDDPAAPAVAQLAQAPQPGQVLPAQRRLPRAEAEDTWAGWWRLRTGATDASPAPVVYRRTLYIVVKGTDNAIYINRFDPRYGWGDWTELPGGGRTPAAPAAVSFGGRLHVFVRGTDDRIYTNSMDARGTWSGWSELPGAGRTPSAPAALVWDNSVYVFVRGTDNLVYRNRLTAGQWSGWDVVPGGQRTEDTPGAVRFQGLLHLFVRADGELRWNWMRRADTWGGWTDVPGRERAASGPAPVIHEGALWLLFRNPDQTIRYKIMSPRWRWGPVRTIPAGLTPSAPAAVSFGGRLYAVVRGTDNAIYLNVLEEDAD